MESSNHQHYYADLGNWNNIPVTVGGLSDNKITEIRNGSSWEIVADQFPNVEEYIYSYSMVSIETELYLFGKLKNII